MSHCLAQCFSLDSSLKEFTGGMEIENCGDAGSSMGGEHLSRSAKA